MSVEQKIRWAKPKDMNVVLQFIKDLAVEENMPEGPEITAETLINDGFVHDPPLFQCFIIEDSKKNEELTTVGYAIFFFTFSSWKGKSLMLEDVYVTPQNRRQGIGKYIFSALSKHAMKNDCHHIDFNVLNWNKARNFYKSIGTVNLTELRNCIRLRYDNTDLNRLDKSLIVPLCKAASSDMEKLVTLIKEHSEEIGMPDEAILSKDYLEKHAFDTSPSSFKCVFLKKNNNDAVNNCIIGYAMYYDVYSTWNGNTMMVDDIYIKPDFRNEDTIKGMINSIMDLAKNTGHFRLEFLSTRDDCMTHYLISNGATNLADSNLTVNYTFEDINYTESEKWLSYTVPREVMLKMAERGDFEDN